MGGQARTGEASNNAALGACLANVGNSTVASRCCAVGHARLPLPLVALPLAGAGFQGDRELALGQPISLLMDRAKPGDQKSHTSFFSVVAQPMYTAVAQAFPDCQALVDKLSVNLIH